MNQDKTLKVSISKTILYSAIILWNIITIGSLSNLIATIPQYGFVFYLIFTRRVDKALFYHLVFVITSISAINVVGMDSSAESIYSYSRLKLIGPVGVSYIVSIILLLLSLAKPSKYPRKILFYKLFRGLLMMAVCGFTIGTIGLLVDAHYSFIHGLTYAIYIFIVIITMFALLLNYSDSFVKMFYVNVIPLLSSAVYASVIAYYVIGISTSYGVLGGVVLKPDLTYYSAILLLSLMYVEKKIIVAIPSALFVLMSINSSGGKEILIIGLAIIFIIIGMWNKSGEKSKKKQTFFRIAIISSGLIIGLVLLNTSISTSSDSLFIIKLWSVGSLFNSDISQIDESPYIRIGEILNVANGYLEHPYFIPFGSGYGGYFQDNLNMFASISAEALERGSYTPSDVASGFYHDAHDTFSIVPFLNGLLGLWILFSYVYKYLKEINNNFCVFAVIPWLLLTFYFNVQIALPGVFLLFSAEYLIKRNINIKNSKGVVCQ